MKLATKERHTFDHFGIIAHLVLLTLAFVAPSIVLIVDGLIFWKNFKMDPFYLLFAYFFPPGSEIHERWYSRELHALVVSALGIPYMLEGGRAFSFNLINDLIVPLCATQCIQKAECAMLSAPESFTVASKLEAGLHIYDQFCITQIRGQIMSSFDCLMILALGYVILMFNAAATVTAWGVLPTEVAWVTPALTLFCIFMLVSVLPYTIASFTRSESLLLRWRNLAKESRNTRCIRRQLAARVSIGFSFGEFRPINHDFRMIYFDSIADRTSNQILVYNNGGSFEL